MNIRNIWNKIFWAMFVIIGIGFVFLAFFGNMLFLDLLLGFAIITMGLHKLGEEYSVKHIKTDQLHVAENMENISKLIQDSHKQLNDKEINMEKKLERNYRNLARKIIEVENRINEVSDLLVKKTTVRSGRRKK